MIILSQELINMNILFCNCNITDLVTKNHIQRTEKPFKTPGKNGTAGTVVVAVLGKSTPKYFHKSAIFI